MAEVPLVEQAFTRLRKDVLIGTFAAGSKLKVEELQQEVRRRFSLEKSPTSVIVTSLGSVLTTAPCGKSSASIRVRRSKATSWLSRSRSPLGERLTCKSP